MGRIQFEICVGEITVFEFTVGDVGFNGEIGV